VKFRFRLDGLLGVRHFELRRRIAALAEKRRAHEALLARREAERSEGRRADDGTRAEVEQGAGGARVQAYAELANDWRRIAAGTGREAAQAERAAAQARVAMMRARTRVEALEKLRERRLERWRAEALRQAQRELDELGARRHRRGGDRS
jgi:flagellar export protein FliJ